jgi:hypothetical protein
MIPCFNRDGMINMIGWYLGETIVARFDSEFAAGQARMAADPTYKPDPFSDKPGAKDNKPKTTADAIAAVVARVNARKAG